MKVLLLNGSPNENGSTFTALSEVAKALEQSGVGSEIMQIGKQPIRGCTACGACGNLGGRCVFDDDRVNRFLEKMAQADGLVVGSPVYYSSPNGAVLALLDRAFYAGDAFAYKPAAAVASARRAGTSAALDALNKYFTISRMPVVPSQYWNMIHGNSAEQARQDLEGLQTMRVLGRTMAWMLKCIEAGKNAGVDYPADEERVWTNFIR